MPRVHTRTRKRAEVKRAMKCAAYPCIVAQQRLGDDLDGGLHDTPKIEDAREIKVGDTYYTWSRRNRGTYFQHKECGYPKRSQLSDRKTVAVEDAIDEAQSQIDAWQPELSHAEPTYDDGYEDVTAALEAVASVARDVGQEYQEGFDNMPEGLNQGPTAQAMEEVAQELESFADDLEMWEPTNTEPDLPDRDDYKQAGGVAGLEGDYKVEDDDYDGEAWRAACESALSDWADEVRSEATDKMTEMPEYQG